jgi:cation diffusion facilitator family transporter
MNQRIRLSAAFISLVLGLAIFIAKYKAYKITGSAAILSDALESVVNVIAAGFALFAIHHAHTPPDKNHPYGHGKIEFIAAVFEGGLICFAAALIAFEAIQALFHGSAPRELDFGIWIILACGLLNGLLGAFLILVGKKTFSLALEADGRHILTDFLSSLGILLGLLLVKWTGWSWLDPVTALGMSVLLLLTGFPLMRRAIGGLLDATEHPLLEKLLLAFEKHRFSGCINVHHIRAMRNGRRIHVDGHIVIPEFWSVINAHDQVDEMTKLIVKDIFPEGGEMELHLDPCRKVYCHRCDLKNCPIRTEPQNTSNAFTLNELINPMDLTDRH